MHSSLLLSSLHLCVVLAVTVHISSGHSVASTLSILFLVARDETVQCVETPFILVLCHRQERFASSFEQLLGTLPSLWLMPTSLSIASQGGCPPGVPHIGAENTPSWVWLTQERTAGLWLAASEEGHFGGDRIQ